MIRGLVLFAIGFIIAHRLESRLATQKSRSHERDDAWTSDVENRGMDSFPASDAPSFNSTTASSRGPH